MRFAFGLAGLLITLGVIVWILNSAILPYTKTVTHEGKKARVEAEQIAGVKDGMRTTDSIKMEVQNSNGHPVSLLVTTIVDDGPMATYFGLKRYDTITEVNGTKVKDWNDGETAIGQALEAYQRKGTLTVVRDGKELTLPAAAAASDVGQPAAKPAESNGLQGQLESIQKAAGSR